MFVSSALLVLQAGRGAAQEARGDSARAIVTVRASGFRFDPPRLVVRPGARVRFANADDIEHTVTFGTPDSADTRLPSATVARRGAVHEVIAPARGAFTYHCARHPFMTGTLFVSDSADGGGSTAAAGPATAQHRPARPGPSR